MHVKPHGVGQTIFVENVQHMIQSYQIRLSSVSKHRGCVGLFLNMSLEFLYVFNRKNLPNSWKFVCVGARSVAQDGLPEHDQGPWGGTN